MQINKIFSSIEGVGRHVGYLTTYVRTFSCNLNCLTCKEEYCVNPTSDEDLTGFTVMTIDDILDECADYGNNHITLCGGEPLIQKDAPELVAALLDEGYFVNIETQGAVDLDTFENKMVDILQDDELLNNLTYTVDYKCPSTGMDERMITDNFTFLVDSDVLTFVVDTEADLDYMVETLEEYTPQAEVYVLPRTMDSKAIVDYMKANNLQNVRIQLSLQKVIYGEDMRED